MARKRLRNSFKIYRYRVCKACHLLVAKMYGSFLCICIALSFTLSEARITNPTGLIITNINVTTVVALWKPIPKEHVQGDILGYILQLHKQNSPHPFQTPGTDETSIVIKDLQPSVGYLLSVQGYTANETGMPSYRWFSIPVVPSTTGLTITKINTTTVLARWNPISKEQLLGVLVGYHVQLRDNISWQIRKIIKTNETSLVVKDLKDWKRYRLEVYGYTSTRTGGTSYYDFDTPTMISATGVNIININVTTVAARWNPIPKKHVQGFRIGYNVRLYNQNNPWKLLQTLKTNETNVVVKYLQPKVYYILSVQGYTVNETGRSSYSSFSIPVLPSTTGLSITKINKTTVLARWNTISKEKVWGDFLGYNVQLGKAYSGQRQTINTKKTSIVLTDLKDWLQYYMYVTGYTSNERGSYVSSHVFYTCKMISPTGLSVTNKNVTTVLARWNPIPQEHVQGVLTGYIVRLQNAYSPYQLLQKLKTNETSIVFKDLQPKLNYRLLVQGYTVNETGRSSYSIFYIRPIIRPSGLNVTITNTSTVAARWDPIPRKHVFGNLIGYKLRLYAYEFNKYFKTNETSFVVKDLQPGHPYRLYVQGYTAKDTGDESYYNFVTQCGGILKNQLRGNITIKWNNNYRYYYYYYDWPTFNCTWEIQGHSSNSITLIILESLYIIPSYQCRNGFLEIIDGHGQCLSRLCGSRNTSMNFVLIGSAKIHLQFHQLLFHKYHPLWWLGFPSYIRKISFSYLMFNNGIENALVKKSWNISASSNSSTSIAVQWTKYPGPETVNNYIAVCFAQNSHDNISSAQTDGQNLHVVVTDLLKNTEYNVVVLAFMKKPLNATIWNATILNEAIWKSRAVVTRTTKDAPTKIPTREIPTAPTKIPTRENPTGI